MRLLYVSPQLKPAAYLMHPKRQLKSRMSSFGPYRVDHGHCFNFSNNLAGTRFYSEMSAGLVENGEVGVDNYP